MLADPDGEVYGQTLHPPMAYDGKIVDESKGMRGNAGRTHEKRLPVSSFVCTTSFVGGCYAQKHDGQLALSFSSCLVLDRLLSRFTVFGKEQTRQWRHQQCSICGFISVALPVPRECNTADQPRCNRRKNLALSLLSNLVLVSPPSPVRLGPSKTRFCRSGRPSKRRLAKGWSARTASLTGVPRVGRRANGPAPRRS